MFDRIAGIKCLMYYPELTHTTAIGFYEMTWSWMDQHLEPRRQIGFMRVSCPAAFSCDVPAAVETPSPTTEADRMRYHRLSLLLLAAVGLGCPDARRKRSRCE